MQLNQTVGRILGLSLLFLVTLWAFYLHLPVFQEGYLNAGDDHIHVAYANELARIWKEEGNILGWSRLYGPGGPIFLLRPPGFYMATALLHLASGLTVEESLKTVVLFGICLYPLVVYGGARLLGLGFGSAVAAGCLSLLPVSLWGHTFDAYHYLGIHKQLLAILLFPLTAGALWRLLRHGSQGFLFAVLFAAMFMTHPYIAYCLALITPIMMGVVLCAGTPWSHWRGTLPKALFWALVSCLLVGPWLLPFVSSPEMQAVDPFLGRRNYFDVTGCTVAETLRHYFLGGLLDTSRFAGPFGGIDWVGGNEWGWIDNSGLFRLPALSFLSLVGFGIALFRWKRTGGIFAALAFLFSLILLMGPDDFPLLDHIPFAEQFQNIHAVFLSDWAAIVLAGMGLSGMIEFVLAGGGSRRMRMIAAPVALLALFAVGSAFHERTLSGRKLIDVRNIVTVNGELGSSTNLFTPWVHFRPMAEALGNTPHADGVAAFPLSHEDSVLYNLLPLMVNKPVHISGFEEMGGPYYLLLHKFRSHLRDSYPIQRLLNIRHVVNSPFHRKEELILHDQAYWLRRSPYWELAAISGDFALLEELPPDFIGFVGSEREWSQLMEKWLGLLVDGKSIPWVLDLSYSRNDQKEMERLAPLVKKIITGKKTTIALPSFLASVETVSFNPDPKAMEQLLQFTWRGDTDQENPPAMSTSLPYTPLEQSRRMESFRITSAASIQPIIMKRSFYRGWEARISGREIPIHRVSPGLQMVLLPPGENRLDWHYTGPNRWGWARTGFAAGAMATAFLFVWRIRKRNGTQTEVPHKGEKHAPAMRFIPLAAALLIVSVFAWKALQEGYYGRIVTIGPRQNQELPGGHGDFYWNDLAGRQKKDRKFQLQIGRDPLFQDIIRDMTVEKTHIHIADLFQDKGPFYYRVRLQVDGAEFPWSPTVRFLAMGQTEER